MNEHRVFSTYVEVIPVGLLPRHLSLGILHVCGGDPEKLDNVATWIEYSPRMWGDPDEKNKVTDESLYSPHMWRYCYIGIPEEIMNVIIRDHKEKF